jgi:hypothetical protein
MWQNMKGRVKFKYILWKNEQVTCGHNKSNTAEKKGGSKQECVDLENFIFNFTYNHSLKNIEMIFFLLNVDLSIVGL